MSADAPRPDSPPRRAASAWVILLLAWVVGLVIWAGYLAMIAYGLYRLLI